MEVDEEEDQLAKTALKQTQAEFKVSINTAEIKRLLIEDNDRSKKEMAKHLG